MMPKRPVLRYQGGKWRIAPWVIEFLPAHRVYVEPFGGAFSVGMRKPPSRIEVYNDLDEQVVSLFRVLRDPDQAEELRRRLMLTNFSRQEHKEAWIPTADVVESARRLVIRSFQSFGTKGSCERNGWRTRTSQSVWSPCVAWNSWPEEVPAFVERLRDVIIECAPYDKLLDVYDATDTLWFVDPPYPLATRQASTRRVYVHEMSDAEHVDLLDRLRQLKGMVAVCSYGNDLYREALSDWRLVQKDARTQVSRPRVECLWLNPALSQHLQPTLWESAA